MRKLILTALCCLPLLGLAQVSDPLRSVSSISVNNGKVESTGVLADSSGTVFVELTKDSFVGSELDQREFNGEILAPYLTQNVVKAPRGRMRELISFDLFTDRADTAIFVDRYAMMHERTRLREQSLFGEASSRSSGAQVLMRLNRSDNIGQAALWRYDTEAEAWTRIGGRTTNSSEPDIDIFSVIISQTGSYTIWDEDPSPEFSPQTDPNLVELAESSPFPSVTPIDTAFESKSLDGFEIPFVETEDTVINDADGFAPLATPINQPLGLIPAVGLAPTEETVIEPVSEALIEDPTPAGEFSEAFLEAIENTETERPAAPEIEDFTPPTGATLPSTGAEEGTINWANYLITLLILAVISGSVYVVRKEPY